MKTVFLNINKMIFYFIIRLQRSLICCLAKQGFLITLVQLKVQITYRLQTYYIQITYRLHSDSIQIIQRLHTDNIQIIYETDTILISPVPYYWVINGQKLNTPKEVLIRLLLYFYYPKLILLYKKEVLHSLHTSCP